MSRLFFSAGSLLAAVAVVMGSVGAHSQAFDEIQRVWIDKGVRYQMFHALALLCTALLLPSGKKRQTMAVVAGCCFLAGIVFFSGSLYFMALTSVDAGYITPAGGFFFIAGWLCLAMCGPGGK